MQKLQSQSTSNPTSIAQKAAVAAFNGPQECVEEMRREYIKLRDHVVKGLRAIPGMKCTMPEGAFYVYPNISAFFGRGGIKSPADFAGKLLREAHVATVPGEGFGTREHIRVSYATSVGTGSRAGAHAEVSGGLVEQALHREFSGAPGPRFRMLSHERTLSIADAAGV